MALNILIFVGLLCILGALAALGGAIWANAASKTVAVGNLVQTTFTGCPALLTTALWGPRGEYWTGDNYGNTAAYQQDAVNSLHCDMPGAKGLYSTWVQGTPTRGGILGSLASNSTLFFSDLQCETDADCQGPNVPLKHMPCGPGVAIPGPWGQGQGCTSPSCAPYTQFQCPGTSWCSVCGVQNNYSCTDASPTSEGYCIGTEPNLQYFCAFNQAKFIGGQGESTRQCAAFANNGGTFTPRNGNGPTSTNTTPFGQFLKCDPTFNWANQDFGSVCSFTVNNYYTNPTKYPSESVPWYLCSSTGNANCPRGQVCAANWDASITGWCKPGFPCPAIPGVTETAQFVCSGTSLPTVVMQTLWIAEGTILTTRSDETFDVAWDRVQNTYNGIGPSLQYQFPGAPSNGTYTNPWVPGPTQDRSWRYSDCRFITDQSGSQSRNTSVSIALLGKVSSVSENSVWVTTVSNPSGLGALGDIVYTPEIQALLAVRTTSFCPPLYRALYQNIGTTQNASKPGDGTLYAPQAGETRNAFQAIAQTTQLYNGVPCNPLSYSVVVQVARSAQDNCTGGCTESEPVEPAINSVWNLQAQGCSPQQLKRIFFNTILPFQVTQDALDAFSQSHNLANTNDLMRGKAPRFH